MLCLRPRFAVAIRALQSRAHVHPAAPNLISHRLIPRQGALNGQRNTLSTSQTNNGVYVGRSGRKYEIQRILREEKSPRRHVCLATSVDRDYSSLGLPAYCFLSAANRAFILKFIHAVNFEDLQDINNKLRSGTSYLRLSEDIIPGESTFVFRWCTGHLLRLSKKDLPIEVIKKILRNALRGLAELHDHDIVHTGKPHLRDAVSIN